MRRFVAALIQVAGIGFAATGGWLFAPALGCAVAGIGLIVFGVATERGGN